MVLLQAEGLRCNENLVSKIGISWKITEKNSFLRLEPISIRGFFENLYYRVILKTNITHNTNLLIHLISFPNILHLNCSL